MPLYPVLLTSHLVQIWVIWMSCQTQSRQSNQKKKVELLFLSRRKIVEGNHKPFNIKRAVFYFPPCLLQVGWGIIGIIYSSISLGLTKACRRAVSPGWGKEGYCSIVFTESFSEQTRGCRQAKHLLGSLWSPLWDELWDWEEILGDCVVHSSSPEHT